jgi:hypothetical protein
MRALLHSLSEWKQRLTEWRTIQLKVSVLMLPRAESQLTTTTPVMHHSQLRWTSVPHNVFGKN